MHRGSAEDLLSAGTLIASSSKAATADTNGGVATCQDPVLALVEKRAHPDGPVTSLRCHLSGQLLRLRFRNKSTYYLSPQRRSGEIGIRTRLKIWRGQTHVGSSPTSGTITRITVAGGDGHKHGRSFWQKHRDKLTTAGGIGAGALIGSIAGGKKGAAIGALAGGGGAAVYTYGIRKRRRAARYLAPPVLFPANLHISIT
jgi:hypothetical protein